MSIRWVLQLVGAGSPLFQADSPTLDFMGGLFCCCAKSIKACDIVVIVFWGTNRNKKALHLEPLRRWVREAGGLRTSTGYLAARQIGSARPVVSAFEMGSFLQGPDRAYCEASATTGALYANRHELGQRRP